MNNRRIPAGLLILANLILFATTSPGLVNHSTVAGYNITCTSLLPAGRDTGIAFAVVGNQQVGGAGCAGLWSGTAGSFVDLTPVGSGGAGVFDTTGTQQAGYYWGPTGHSQAAIWSGTAASVRSLHPAGAVSSVAYATSGNQQVGYTDFSNDYLHRASLWRGTAGSFVDLHPASAYISYAWDTSGTRQVGSVSAAAWSFQDHAAIWSGTAASFVDLNPSGAMTSMAYSIDGTQVAGYAAFADGNWHAGRWTGTAGSFVDLNPAGAVASLAMATMGGIQAGSVTYDGPTWGAAVWLGQADSLLDLHAALGTGYWMSGAEGIWTDGSIIRVVGVATDVDGFTAPTLWTITPVPEPSAFSLLALMIATLALKSRTVRP